MRRDRREIAALRHVVEAALRRVLGANDFELEDLVQCSLERAIRAVDRGAYQGASPLEMWTAAIARNVAIDALRARMRERALFVRGEAEDELLEKASSDAGPDQAAETRNRCDAIAAALLQLSPQTARVVYLHDSLGYRLDEVAARTGMTVAATQSRLVRGRRRVVAIAKAIESGGADAPNTDGAMRETNDGAIRETNDGAIRETNDGAIRETND